MQYGKTVLLKLFILDGIHFCIEDDSNLLDDIDLKG